MTDYICFIDSNPISIYEYKDMIIKDPSLKKTLTPKCICGEAVYFKDESVHFERHMKNGQVKHIQMVSYFSHYKNSNCGINRLFKANNNHGTIISPAPNKTEFEKRLERIDQLLKAYHSGLYREEKLKISVLGLSNIINENNLDIKIHEDLLKIKSNYYNEISFRFLEFIKIDYGKKYKLIDLHKKEIISYNLYYRICNDYETFKIYVKNLSLIILYYSRCINKNFNLSINEYLDQCKEQLMKKINEDEYNPIIIKYLRDIESLRLH